MAKMHNLFGNKVINTEVKNKNKTKTPTSTSTQIIEKTKQTETTTIETPTQPITNTETTTTSTHTESKINKNIIKSTDEKWIKTIDGLPEENRAVMFNTYDKKQVTGYKLPNGDYVVNDAYSINNFKKKNGYLEWRYINCGNTLDFCEHGFPNCLNCKAFKTKE